jgi:hypothetical protein
MLSLESEISAEERDQLLHRVADEVVRRGLESPAVLFLEAHRPLQFLTSQALVVFSPLLAVVFRPEILEKTVVLMQDRQNLDRLIHRIEALSQERRAGGSA